LAHPLLLTGDGLVMAMLQHGLTARDGQTR
jgi:hypothetical protein